MPPATPEGTATGPSRIPAPRGTGGLPAYPRQTEPGYYGPRRYGPNGLAVSSFVLGLADVVPLGLILGGMALGRIRDTGQSGKWLAISGMTLAVLWILAWAMTLSSRM